jgi:hypothetical protein
LLSLQLVEQQLVYHRTVVEQQEPVQQQVSQQFELAQALQQVVLLPVVPEQQLVLEPPGLSVELLLEVLQPEQQP